MQPCVAASPPTASPCEVKLDHIHHVAHSIGEVHVCLRLDQGIANTHMATLASPVECCAPILRNASIDRRADAFEVPNNRVSVSSLRTVSGSQ